MFLKGGLKTETGKFLLHFQNSKSSNRCQSVYGTDITSYTNVQSSVSLRILHPDVLCKKYTRMEFMNKIHSKTLLQNTLEHTLLRKLHSGVQFSK